MSLIGGLIVLMCGFLISRGTAPPDTWLFLIIGLVFVFKDYIFVRKK